MISKYVHRITIRGYDIIGAKKEVDDFGPQE